MSRLQTALRRLAPLVLVAFAAGAIAAHADDAAQRSTPPLIVPASAPPRVPPAVNLLACRPTTKRPATAATPPSQALLDAFAILRRERRPEDALPAEALRALKGRNLAPVAPESARLLRTGPGGGRAWVVPVPDVTNGYPLPCGPSAKRGAREGLAVVAVSGAAPGGGGALDDLVRGRAPVWIDACSGENRDLLGVSGIVPNGVTAVFLTAPDGTAVRADVKDNGYEFLVPRPRRIEQRYVVWTGGDGTPHVQPIVAMGTLRGALCKRLAALDRMPRVTPVGAYGPCSLVAPAPMPARPNKRDRPPAARVLWAPCMTPGPALAVPPISAGPVPFFPKAVPKRAPGGP